MRLLDSNLIIYSALPEYHYLRSLIKLPGSEASAVSRLGVLGFRRLEEQHKRYFEAVFTLLPVLPITDSVLETAILFRQQRKLSVGDAIIAATDYLHKLELNTRNTRDFDWIPGLQLHNPVL